MQSGIRPKPVQKGAGHHAMDSEALHPYIRLAMSTAFVKMHGLGNDFAIFDARAVPMTFTPARVRLLADRRRGIGCDQLVVLEPSTRADLFMRIYNPDGSESGACGNATRCVASLLGGGGTIETRAGLLYADAVGDAIRIDMGAPVFDWNRIPLAYPMDTSIMPVGWRELSRPAAVSMGNPHIIFFVEDCDAVPLESLGPEIEQDPLFPERVNVNIATIEGPDHIRLRVWERGAGLTLACGSGACATFAAAHRRKLVGMSAQVELPGGTLVIARTPDGTLTMTGPAARVYSGETEL